MKNNKERIFTIIIILAIFIITLFCYITNKFSNEKEQERLNYNAVSSSTTYYDWSAVSS